MGRTLDDTFWCHFNNSFMKFSSIIIPKSNLEFLRAQFNSYITLNCIVFDI